VGTSSGSKSEGGTGSSRTRGGRAANASGSANGTGSSSGNGSAAKATGSTGAKTTGSTSGTRRRTASGRRTAEASAAGATARARIGSARSRTRATSQAKKDDIPIVEPIVEASVTVPADDETLAASNARRALSPDMARVAWLRTQLNQMDARQRDRLIKVAQLTLIAIVFITFVLQNAQPVNVHLLLFSVNIRLIWVIFGCALLGGAAGYVIGRPDKNLRALLPQKDKKTKPARSRSAGA
jgi:uncharacterized integral membrane protein